MGRYEGKKVVITGGSSGLGLATARSLADEGARVLITGRDQDKLNAAREQLGGNVIAVRSDAASLPEIQALADRVKAEFGTVDALFANAGVTGSAPFEATSEELYDQLLAINAKGPYFTVQKLAPLLAEGSGVVLTTSAVNVLGLPMLSAYAAGKAALRSMTRSLARELLPRKIRVNAVSPGPIDTRTMDQSIPVPYRYLSRRPRRHRRRPRRHRRLSHRSPCCDWEPRPK
ncbi:SDR family NAD(P)-dependent oxidoreductase [Streptomyces sp. CB02923]|uniref:SDR family NAD(P)-dependent oxidoreductase n=1 Tax=Streptomyces sp. CB02923 TaxID=1718985 RepID=UPI000A8B78DC